LRTRSMKVTIQPPRATRACQYGQRKRRGPQLTFTAYVGQKEESTSDCDSILDCSPGRTASFFGDGVLSSIACCSLVSEEESADDRLASSRSRHDPVPMVPLQSSFGHHCGRNQRTDCRPERVEALQEPLHLVCAGHVACPCTPCGVSQAVAEASENEEGDDDGPRWV
jgi:hypothetical protein